MQTGQKGKGGMPMNQKGLAAKLVKLNHITHKIVLFIAQASILAMVAIVTLTVILRYCFNTGLSWAEEVPRLLVTVFAFIACAIGVRDHMHVAVNAIYNKFPVGGKVRKALALLRDAPVLLLDEATSALDVTTERTILRNLAARYPHKTCIVTTHRPTVISLCRRVYQVSGGRMELLDNDRAQRLAMDF